MVIAVDFDGTSVTHEYPYVGKDIGAIPILKKLQENGHDLILYTMRSGKQLKDAEKFYETNNIKLYGVNRNPTQNWTTSPKCYAELFIDDASLGIPLKFDKEISKKPFVDWEKVEVLLKEMKLL